MFPGENTPFPNTQLNKKGRYAGKLAAERYHRRTFPSYSLDTLLFINSLVFKNAKFFLCDYPLVLELNVPMLHIYKQQDLVF